MAQLALLPENASIWLVTLGVLGQSLGASISLAALHRASMMDISETQTGIAAGIYSMIRFAGVALGTALCGVILQQGLAGGLMPITAYQTAFWFVAAVALMGVVLGIRIKV